MSKAAFFDLDSTIRVSKSGKITPDTPEDQVVMPGRKEKLKELKAQGYKIFAVSNQGGIAMGYTTHEKVKKALADLDHRLGYVFDDMSYSPHMGDHPTRKPNPGMIHELAEKHGIDLSKSFMVGDLPSDEEAAKRAGLKYHDASDFFSKKEEPVRAGKGAGWL
jgi:D-glycero-D-manno-heptose 1,7-bisphosphate phosphatase